MNLYLKYLNKPLVIITIFIITNTSFALNEFEPKSFLLDAEYKEIKLTDQDNTHSIIGSVCSVATWNQNSILVANYLNIIHINLETGEIKVLDKPLGIDKWYPTGLKWHKETQRLYVANYLGHDILILKLSEDKLVLDKRIIDNELDGPENIDVTDDGSLISVADFNNNKLIVFNKNGKKLWSADIGRAHGVAFSSDQKNIFVSGLYPAKVYKFSIDGQLINEIGKPCFGKDGFLWPTSITTRGKYIYISDAHTGKITQLDNDLHSIKTYGGNGLGGNLFNMPYGIAFLNDNDVIVADTFKGRLLVLDLKRNSITLSYSGIVSPVSLQNVDILSPSSKESVPKNFFYQNKFSNKIEPLGLHYNARLDTRSNFVIPMPSSQKEFFTGRWKASYNSIISEQDSQILSLSGAHYFFSSSIYYWILADNVKINNKHYMIIGSPESPEWIVGRDGLFVPIYIGFDNWLYDESLCSSTGRCIKYQNIAKLVEEKISKMQASALTDIPPLQIIENAYNMLGNNDIEKMFSSVEGKELLQQIKTESDSAKINSIALKFLQELDKKSLAYFPEFMFASTIFSLTTNSGE